MARVITEYGNYVKFLRGTPNAYQQLSPKDNDTLYFISETDADHGVLYLGEKLISGGISSSTSLADLQDVLIGAGVETGSLLFYDGTQWVDKPLDEIFELIVGSMVGATATKNGKTGLVPVPLAGMQDLYLKGDGTWNNPLASIQPTVSLLISQVGTLIGNDTNQSVRDIALDEVSKVVANAPEAFDTLKEIADYLEEHPSSGDVAGRLAALEQAVLTPTTGLQDRMVAVESNMTNVSNAISTLQAKDRTHDQQITNINQTLETLKWQQMIVTN